MGGAFSHSSKSSKKRPEISDIDRAILDLKNARDRLQKYRTKLEKDDAKLVEKARQAKQDNKERQALGLLRLRRYKQRELENVESQLLTVLQMVQTIDSKQNETEILKAMKSGKEALSQMHAEHSVDDVLELMDQITEEHEVEQEISDILAGVPELSVEDEAAVEQELEELEKQLLPSVPSTKLPKLPSAVPAASNTEVKPASTSTTGRVALPS